MKGGVQDTYRDIAIPNAMADEDTDSPVRLERGRLGEMLRKGMHDVRDSGHSQSSRASRPRYQMHVDERKKVWQSHFADGLVIIVGSGLSAAEGMPGMPELAEHLMAEVPSLLSPGNSNSWAEVEAQLRGGIGLEAALAAHPPTTAVEEAIVQVTSDLFRSREQAIVETVLRGDRLLRLTKLIPHLLKPDSGLPIVTTNYDRLVEVACEMGNLGVDTGFVGNYAGRFNAKESTLSYCREVQLRGKRPVLKYAKRALICKPHGSLDWYFGKEPIRSSWPLSQAPMIITPGLNKYRSGYNPPFDAHRERGNRHIDAAAVFLILGYGFNDDHLETHLAPQLRKGKRALILTHSLSSRGAAILAVSPNATAIVAPEGGGAGAEQITIAGRDRVAEVNLWDLAIFIDEVLTP